MAKEKINWLLILQGWAMMWVIIGHCPMGSYGEDSNLIVELMNFAYSFHMPCFIFISGYLFYLTRIRNSMTWKNMFSDKLKRFGIPYIVFSILTLAIKSMAGGELSRPVEFSLYNFFMALISPGDGPLALLWFIIVILWLFALYPIWKYILDRRLLTIAVLLGLLALNLSQIPYCQILSITSTLKFSVYFFLGMIFSKYQCIENVKSNKFGVFITSMILYVVSRAYDIPLIPALSGIAFSIVLSLYADRYIPKLFSSFRDYTYQIYLIGLFFQILVKLLYKKGLVPNYELGIILNILLGIYLPVLISVIVKKINYRPLGLCIGLSK
ncbi:MAG: acyltransferase family protein [Muribaculaceae bacterium]